MQNLFCITLAYSYFCRKCRPNVHFEPYKGRGIVLNTIKYGEKALIVSLLTDVAGRQSYIVQGIRSGRGSRAGIFQPLFPLQFEGMASKSSDLHRFREVQTAQPLLAIPFDVRKSTIGLFMAEVLYRLVREAEPNPALFDFAWASVAALDQLQEGVANFHLWFLSHLSRLLGFSPGNSYTKGDRFDLREGLFTPFPSVAGMEFSAENARLLNDFLQCDVRCLGEIGMNRTERVAFLQALLAYYAYHLDAIRAVQSVQVLQEVF